MLCKFPYLCSKLSSENLRCILFWVIYNNLTLPLLPIKMTTANSFMNLIWRERNVYRWFSKGRVEEKMKFVETMCYCSLWLLKLLLCPQRSDWNCAEVLANNLEGYKLRLEKLKVHMTNMCELEWHIFLSRNKQMNNNNNNKKPEEKL